MSATSTLEPLEPFGTPQPLLGRPEAWIWGLAGAVALILLTVLSYVPAVRAGYIWDDNDHVTNNITFDQPHALRRVWLDPGTAPQYYPLAHSIFLAQHHWFHDNPMVGHTLNIVLQVANGLLLWLLLRQLSIPGAWFAAALWAVHPVNVESVAWVTELKNVLSGFFYLLAALAYFQFCGAAERPPKRRSWIFYWLALAAFVLALWSKTVTASLPGAIMLVLWWKNRRVGWREAIPAGAAGLLGFPLFLGIFGLFRLGETTIPMPILWTDVRAAGNLLFTHPMEIAPALRMQAFALVGIAALCIAAAAMIWRIRWREILPLCPFFALGVAQGQLTAYVEKALIGAEGFDWQFTNVQRLLMAGRVPWHYAWCLVWPHNLMFMYQRWNLDPQEAWQWFFPVGTAVLVAALWFGRKWIGGGAIAAVTFFVMTLVPALGFFDVYPFRYSLVADHFQYLAGIGIIVLAVGTVVNVSRRLPALNWLAVVACGLLAGTVVMVALRILGETLQLQAVVSMAGPLQMGIRQPSGVYMALVVGIVAMVLVAVAARALRGSRPDVPWAMAMAGVMFAALFTALSFNQSRIYRDLETLWMDTLAKNPTCWLAYNNLGGMWFNRGDPVKAMSFYDKSLAINPRNGEAYNNRAVVWEKWAAASGNVQYYDRALEDYDRAVDFSQRLLSPRENRAHFFLQHDQPERALADFDYILERVPAFRAFNVYITRAALRTRLHRYPEALADCDVAAGFAPAVGPAWKVRGDIYQNMGIAEQERARANPDPARDQRASELFRKAADAYSKSLGHMEGASPQLLNDIYVQRAVCYGQLKQYDPALADLSAAIRIQPNDPRLYNLRGQCLFAMRRFDQAWDQVHECRSRGGQPDPAFLKSLMEATGRSE